MSISTVSGPRLLGADDYKEFMIETETEADRTAPKKPAKKPQQSWRSEAGFVIPESPKKPNETLPEQEPEETTDSGTKKKKKRNWKKKEPQPQEDS
jgi:hypothetical protein